MPLFLFKTEMKSSKIIDVFCIAADYWGSGPGSNPTSLTFGLLETLEDRQGHCVLVYCKNLGLERETSP